MIHDAALPPGLPPPPTAVREIHGHLYTSAQWSGEELLRLATVLGREGAPSLRSVATDRLLAVWSAALASFLDPGSDQRRRLDPILARSSGLSREGLQAGLEALLGGVTGRAAERLVREAEPASEEAPILVFLASNLPALGVQPLLPALALRRPVLFKSPSSEPLLMPALVTELARREPLLAPALAAVVWKGGDQALETSLLQAVGPVVVYGGQEAIDDLAARVPERLVPYGPKASIALLAADADLDTAAAGLARDIALFDQRGCLSIQAIYTAGSGSELADRLAAELDRLAVEWPPGAPDPAAAAAVHQLRTEADLRGLYRPELPLDAGTVIVEPLPDFRPSPGLRTVRIHPVPDLAAVPGALERWKEQLQGAALAGGEAQALRPQLERSGLSRFASPGELQAPDALWHNGGIHPLAALGG